jgi:hypothetical protein
LGITIPTNGKYEDLIKLNYDEKKVKIKDKRYVSCGTIKLFIIVTFPNKVKLLLLHDE